MIAKDKKTVIVKWTYGLLVLLMLMLIIRSYAGFIYGTFVTSIPGEYMDVVNVQATEDIVNHVNPYVFKNNPVDNYIYAYTPFNSVLAAFVSMISGVKAYRAHYILTFVWVSFSALLAALYINKRTKNKLLSILTFMLILTVIQRNSFVSISTVPDMLGVFVSIVILILLDNSEEISYIVLSGVILASVLLFYIKQYYVIFAATVFIYLLIKNYKKAFIYVIGCLSLGLISLYVINYFCPLFTTQTIYCFLNSDGEAEAVNNTGFMLSIRQMGKIVKYYAPALVFYVCTIVRKAARAIERFVKRRTAYKSVEEVKLMNINVFEINTFIMFFVLLFYLGKHDGAYLSYHLQLMVPSLVLAAILGINSFNEEISDIRDSKAVASRFGEFVSKGNTLLWSTVFIISVLCVLYCMLTSVRIGVAPIYTDEDNTSWEAALNELKGYSEDEILVLAPSVGYYCLENNIPVIGNGHNYMRGMEDGIDRSAVVMLLEKIGLMGHLDEYYDVAVRRRDMIIDSINNKDYKLIVVPEGGYLYFTTKEEGYEKFNTYTLRTGYEFYKIAFYKAN